MNIRQMAMDRLTALLGGQEPVEASEADLTPQERDSMTKARSRAATTASNAHQLQKIDERTKFGTLEPMVSDKYAAARGSQAAAKQQESAMYDSSMMRNQAYADSGAAARDNNADVSRSIDETTKMASEWAGDLGNAQKMEFAPPPAESKPSPTGPPPKPGVYTAEGDPWTYVVDASGIKVSKDGQRMIPIEQGSPEYAAIAGQVASGQLKPMGFESPDRVSEIDDMKREFSGPTMGSGLTER